MKKKIYIRAYNKNNLGDDLFIQILADRYAKEQFILEVDDKFSVNLKGIQNLQTSNVKLS